MLLGVSHRHRGEPHHKSLSFFFSCKRNPEVTPLETALQEVNYWTPTLWLRPVLAFGSTMKSWVAKQLARWQLQLREDHCAHGLLHAHDGSSVQGKYCSIAGCLLLLLVAMQSAVWTSKKQHFAPVAKPPFSISDFLSHSEDCFWSRLKHAHWPVDRNDRNGVPSCFLPDSLSSSYTIIRCRKRRWRPKMKLWLWGHSVDNRGVSRGS